MKNKKGILVIILIFTMMAVGCITITPASEFGQIWVENNSSYYSYWVVGPRLRNYVMEYEMRSEPLEPGKQIYFPTFEDGEYLIYYKETNPVNDALNNPRNQDFRQWLSKSVTIKKGELVRIQIP